MHERILLIGLTFLRHRNQFSNTTTSHRHVRARDQEARHGPRFSPRAMSLNRKSVNKPTRNNCEDATTVDEMTEDTATEASPCKKPRNACKHLFSMISSFHKVTPCLSYGTDVYKTPKFTSEPAQTTERNGHKIGPPLPWT